MRTVARGSAVPVTSTTRVSTEAPGAGEVTVSTGDALRRSTVKVDGGAALPARSVSVSGKALRPSTSDTTKTFWPATTGCEAPANVAVPFSVTASTTFAVAPRVYAWPAVKTTGEVSASTTTATYGATASRTTNTRKAAVFPTGSEAVTTSGFSPSVRGRAIEK